MHELNVAVTRLVHSEEEGATMVEYGVMLALIAAVCVGAITLIGTDARAMFSTIARSLNP